MALQSYRELKVWQLGMKIAVACYELTRSFPKEERFGLTGQICRASSRIPANIAEGYGRGHRREYIQFLRVANGSLKETETHLILAGMVGIAREEDVRPILVMCEEEGKMLASQIRSLEAEESA